MRYVVDINQKQSETIQELIRQGHYSSVAQFLSVAIENQIYLEESGEQANSSIKNTSIVTSELKRNIVVPGRWDIYKLHSIVSTPQTVPMPAPSQLPLTVSENEAKKMWLWGQINKILPVKIGLRVLYGELENDKFIEVDRFLEKALQAALTVSAAIRNYEDKLGKGRGEKISAGLPNEDEKSQARYKSQFLIYLRRDELIDGALPLLKFVNIDSEGKSGKTLLGITKEGIEFAKISNPSLDQSLFNESLSEEEIDYYVKHIKRNVPNEYNAIKWMLQKINSGIDERKALNHEMTKEFEKKWGASSAVINTQRSGLISRMFELKLIEKDKDGIRVTYRVSASGKSFLENN